MKRTIIAVIITAIIFTGVGALATTAITADQVNYDENTTVKDKIDDLYTEVSRSISFSNAQYSESMGDVVYSRTSSITLSKGKYIIILGVQHTGGNMSSQIDNKNGTSNLTRTLSCTSCTSTNISGRYYHPTASTILYSNIIIHENLDITAYYVEVTNNQDTISYTRTMSWELNSLPQSVIIQAIPISK